MPVRCLMPVRCHVIKLALHLVCCVAEDVLCIGTVVIARHVLERYVPYELVSRQFGAFALRNPSPWNLLDTGLRPQPVASGGRWWWTVMAVGPAPPSRVQPLYTGSRGQREASARPADADQFAPHAAWLCIHVRMGCSRGGPSHRQPRGPHRRHPYSMVAHMVTAHSHRYIGSEGMSSGSHTRLAQAADGCRLSIFSAASAAGSSVPSMPCCAASKAG